MAKSSTPSLNGKIALVTGASRGIGRGIALQLGQAGATVYITGRQPNESLQNNCEYGDALPTLEKTKQDIEDRGGKAVLVYCDHSDSESVKALFERIDSENGVLDILVNNAFSAVNDINNTEGKPFYELDPNLWDKVNNVGLRNHYICSVYAARMMTKRKSGLIINVSSIGGLTYAFNVAYGVGKMALDRMAADMAEELKDTGVTIFSLWPAAVKTECARELITAGKVQQVVKAPTDMIEESLTTGETVEYAGRCIVHMAADTKVNKRAGKIVFTSDVARHYGFKDIDGATPQDMRSVSVALKFFGWRRLAAITPACLRIPLTAMHFTSYKFE
ncbi:hypothetical protein PFISCL1PPCAC_6795 [Pristionchus fissidentatus]|uniref:Dehydrogenase n=1 Tax=Pristionchus fissidentatus TaxID=1538716 RepID=A0AAV5V8G9_9BILA|nr:hypothetical protein PFISCL1PPCAC_6795 [Pristionchus fissidentatus]